MEGGPSSCRVGDRADACVSSLGLCSLDEDDDGDDDEFLIGATGGYIDVDDKAGGGKDGNDV